MKKGGKNHKLCSVYKIPTPIVLSNSLILVHIRENNNMRQHDHSLHKIQMYWCVVNIVKKEAKFIGLKTQHVHH